MMIAHTYIGHWMIKVGETDLADMISEVVLHHHENFDGSGYYGKGNDDISLVARIIHLADVFSALTTDRAYLSGLGFGRSNLLHRKELWNTV